MPHYETLPFDPRHCLKRAHYLPGLNTLRFWAASIVVVAHCHLNLRLMGISWMQNPLAGKGHLAVELFFVISGFLLTYLAIMEYRKKQSLDVRAFFIRRALRILPLYFLSVVLGYISLYLADRGGVPSEYHEIPFVSGALCYLFMIPNFVIAQWTHVVGAHYSLWSIGVEEQFYLLFPFAALWLFHSKRNWRTILVALVSYFLVWHLLQSNRVPIGDVTRKFLGTLEFQFMLFGSLGAFLITSTSFTYLKEVLLNKTWVKAVLILLFLFLFFTENLMPVWTEQLLTGMVFILLILSITQHNTGITRWEVQPLSYLGTISFGIYIFHTHVSYVLRFILGHWVGLLHAIQRFPTLYFVIELSLTIGVAHISYRYFENYFLKLKDRYIR